MSKKQYATLAKRYLISRSTSPRCFIRTAGLTLLSKTHLTSKSRAFQLRIVAFTNSDTNSPPVVLTCSTCSSNAASCFLNSRNTTWYYRSNTDEEGKAFAQIKIELLRKMPIPKADKDRQRPVIQLVGTILAAKKRDAEADTSALERQIDELVYALYGLTPEEIKRVEESGK